MEGIYLLCFVLAALLLHLSYGAHEKEKYIVYLGHKGELEPHHVISSHHTILTNIIGSKDEASESIVHSFKHALNGFSAYLTKEQSEAITDHPGVISVFKSKKLKLHTTRSWDFLGYRESFGPGKLNFTSGHDVIVGVMDSGVWPESKSFSDAGMGPVPSRWRGVCDNSLVKNVSHTFHCNKKLIGARAYATDDNNLYQNARDEDGHGTHTASTIAGNFVEGVDIFGLGNMGVARGGNPSARLAIYRVCVDDGCEDDSILAAFDDAIHDGVDIISLSLGGENFPYSEDAIALGAFHAMQRGILVSCSAGNSGPDPSSLSNVAPWILTVGATTIDRGFSIDLKLGNGKTLQGTGINPKSIAASSVITGADAGFTRRREEARFCAGRSLDPKKVQGNIVLCEYSPGLSSLPRIEQNLKAAGATGLIVARPTASQMVPGFFTLPGALVTDATLAEIFAYLNSTRNATLNIYPAKVVLNKTRAPVIAKFSSRGPAFSNLDILKPDLVAPGVNILAAWSSVSQINELGAPIYSDFNIISGTSMSCPHASGAAALIKSVHHKWSPAAIRSALMTTATILDNRGGLIQDHDGKDASPFALGAGEINPMAALEPGLIYDISPSEFISYLCLLNYTQDKLALMTGQRNISCPKDKSFQLNYPSIAVPSFTGEAIVTRTVTNVGAERSVYKALVAAPPGIRVSVEPKELKFKHVSQKLSFKVKFSLEKKPPADVDWVGGYIAWANDDKVVRSVVLLGF